MSEQTEFVMVDDKSVRAVAISDLIRLLNGAAYARAAALSTHMVYQPFREANAASSVDRSWSALVNVMMQATTGMPGFAAVEQDDGRIDRLRVKFLHQWIGQALDEAGQQGFKGLEAYMADKARERVNDLMKLQRVFHQTQRANAELEEALSTAVVWAARTKLACSVVIAVSPLAAGAGLLGAANATAQIVSQAGVVSFIYSVGKSVAKDAAKGENPAGGAAKEVAKKVAKDKIKGVAKGVAASAAIAQNNHAIDMKIALNKVDSLTRRLAQAMRDGKRAQTVRRIAAAQQNAAKAASAASKAKWVGAGAKAVPVIFAAQSVWSAISEYNEDVSAL